MPRQKWPFWKILIVVLDSIVFLCAFVQTLKYEGQMTLHTPLDEVTFAGKTLYYGDAKDPPVKDEKWVMYQSLDDADKKLYDLFLDLVENREKWNYKNTLIIPGMELKKEDIDHFFNVYYAMRYDHPEYFYLWSKPHMLNTVSYSTRGSTSVEFTMDKPDEEEKAQIITFEKATEEFMRDIDLSASDREIEMQIHDKLINLVSYNQELYAYSFQDEVGCNLGYTAYGALVQDSSGVPNYAVCSGYSLAYEHLLHEAGIPCGFIAGEGKSFDNYSQSQGRHAWNAVKIDDKWYEVDTTWDDFEFNPETGISDEIKKAYESNEEVKYNTTHHYFNRTTKEMEYLPAGKDTVLKIQGFLPFNLRSDTSHIRLKEINSGDDGISAYLNTLIPIAE